MCGSRQCSGLGLNTSYGSCSSSSISSTSDTLEDVSCHTKTKPCALEKSAVAVDDTRLVDLLKKNSNKLVLLQTQKMLLMKNSLVEMNLESTSTAQPQPPLLCAGNLNSNALSKNKHSEKAIAARMLQSRVSDYKKSFNDKFDSKVENKPFEKPNAVVAWGTKVKTKSQCATDQTKLEKSNKQHRIVELTIKKQEEIKKEIKIEQNNEINLNKETNKDAVDNVKKETKNKQKESDTSKMSPANNFTLTRTKTIMSPIQNASDNDLKYSGLADMSNNKPKEGKQTFKENEMSDAFLIARSKTMPTLNRIKLPPQKLGSTANDGERLRLAKELAERAIKYKKIFTIQGGYSTVRSSLRKRGWVEKFYKLPITLKKNPPQKDKKNSDDDDNDDDDAAIDDDDDDDVDDMDNDQPKVPPWEEDDGIYGIMSRLVRNINPTLFWVLKRDAIDYRFLTKDQMVNHYCKAGSFTTKVGLCVNMRNVVWFDNTDHNTFFPRCYRLSHDEDKDAFIDDYRLTACMNIVKMAVQQHLLPDSKPEEDGEVETARTDPETSSPKGGEGDKKKDEELASPEDKDTSLLNSKKRKKTKAIIPVRVLETAVYQCEKFLASKDHEDIDMPSQTGQLTDQQWDDLIQWFYQLVHEEGVFINVPINLVNQCESLTRRLAQHCPQFEMDGIRNVWIVKPGAKSRGRGIICYEKLEDMLKLVASQVVKKDGKYVVQKYIERPLLIYNTKFDIRQWFLVTDWNPLTLWFYRDSYLRFCSQQFTLEDFDQSIHLSNNAIQKHYKNGPRSPQLPVENMWTHYEFKDYLKKRNRKQPNAWDELIYPNMKKAIICSLLVTQDLVEYRKSSFELYGADFMLTEDLTPWLIEINSSPSMESSTSVTAKLCSAVLDDTIKVIVDRKLDRNCDIGAFELAYKQALVTVPPYIGINLCVEGQSVRKPSTMTIKPQAKQSDQNLADSLFTPRPVTMRQTVVDRNLEMKKSGLVGESSPVKNDKSKMFDAAAIKFQQSVSTRDIAAKVSTFRSPGEVEKLKASKVTNGSAQSTSTVESTNVSGSSWNQSCHLCGRGGGLQLDLADPNCKCQRDSVVVNSCPVSQEHPMIITSLNLQSNKMKSYTRTKIKKTLQRNYITPAQPPASDDEDTSQNKQLRPISVHTEASVIQMKQSTSQGKTAKRRKSVVAQIQPPTTLSLYTPPYGYKIQSSLVKSQDIYQGKSFSYISGNWQNVIFDKPQPYVTQATPYSLPYSVHQGLSNGFRAMVGVKTNNTSNSMVKIWPPINSQDTNMLMTPLSVMVQQRLQLKHSKGI